MNERTLNVERAATPAAAPSVEGDSASRLMRPFDEKVAAIELAQRIGEAKKLLAALHEARSVSQKLLDLEVSI